MTKPSWSRLGIHTTKHDDDDDDCGCPPATPLSMKLPIKTRIPFPQTLPLSMELPIRAMLSLQHEHDAQQLRTRQQRQQQSVANPPDPCDPCDPCDGDGGPDDGDDDGLKAAAGYPRPLPAERTMSKLVPRSPYWQAQQAAYIARNRHLDELTLLRQAVQDLDCKVEQFKWPEPLKVQTQMSAEDVRRIENCENAVLGYAEQLKQHDAQLESTQVQLKTVQAQLERWDNRLQACEDRLEAILKRLNAVWQQAQGAAPARAAAKKAAARKSAQP